MGEISNERRQRPGSPVERISTSVEASTIRHDRVRLMAFVADAATETALREGLSEALPNGSAIHHGGVQAATKFLHKSPTPLTLIVDVSGEAEPLAALARLAEVVEPSAQVLVIGNSAELAFYREVTRGLGAQEYLARPLTRDAVRRHFMPLLLDKPSAAIASENIASGKVISVTGARGGVGTTTVAANLAWYFGQQASRHTALLDPDLHFGSAAMLLDCPTGQGLRVALESPERIDPLFVERSAQPVSDRLHVLAGEIRLSDPMVASDGSMQCLLDAMTHRYSIIVADTPRMPHPLFTGIFNLAHQRVVVMAPTLVSVRDARRLLAIPSGPAQPNRALVVLNRADQRGGLTRAQVEQALGIKIDVVIPDLPRLAETAATMGEALSDGRNAFARAIATLARQTAYTQLLDSPLGLRRADPPRPWWRKIW
jgi:pilus assembly protein CpaE